MRTRLIPAAFVLLLSLGTSNVVLSASATPPPAPTSAPKATTPVPTKAPPTPTPQPTATPVPPTPTEKPAPTPQPAAQPPAPAIQQTVEAQIAVASKASSNATPTAEPTTQPVPAVQQTVEAQVAAASKGATPVPNATPTSNAPAVRSAFSISGVIFLDLIGSGYVAGAPGVANAQVRVTGPSGREWQTKTDAQGAFRIEGLAAGSYHLSLALPQDLTAGAAGEQDVQVTKSAQQPVLIGVKPADPASAPVDAQGAQQLAPSSPEPSPTAAEPDGTPTAGELDPGEQDAAVLSMVSLPLRFAPGRDTLAQVARRTLDDGSVWLGVPFRTQIDGSQYQFVNCGPASLTMVFAGFGLDIGPNEVRDYLNSLTHDYNTDIGTSLDVLSSIARQAGLEAIDLYSQQGGYRTWTTDAVRWHLEHGHPVITLVKYNNLPGHSQSSATTDHYIVITGLTSDGFIYNDAAFATTMGYGLEIKDDELLTAWNNSSIPHNAVAMALPQPGAILSFPEQPKPTPVAEELQPAPLVSSGKDGYQPAEWLPTPATVATSTTLAAAVDGAAPAPAAAEPAPDDASSDDPTASAETIAAPQVTVSPDPGPLRLAPEIAVLLGALWAGAITWSALAGLGRRMPAIAAVCVRIGTLLACFHVL